MATKTSAKSSTKSSARSSAKTSKTAKSTGPAPLPCMTNEKIPYNYTPIGMWGYFGWQFLFNIPVIGWILCVACAFMAENHNLRNFARSQFCWIIIYVILFCVLAGVGALATVLSAFNVI